MKDVGLQCIKIKYIYLINKLNVNVAGADAGAVDLATVMAEVFQSGDKYKTYLKKDI